MATRFSLDGNISNTPDDLNDQELLKSEVEEFESVQQDNIETLRIWRSAQLKESDWMAYEDSPTMTSDWKTYRQKLRDLPAISGGARQLTPDADFPIAPGESKIDPSALNFVASSDILGIGTTSWIGVGTDGVYFRQERPKLTITVGTSATTFSVQSSTHVDFTVNITNTACAVEYEWSTEGAIFALGDTIFNQRDGKLIINPYTGTSTGVGTVAVCIASTTTGTIPEDSNLSFVIGDATAKVTKTVGITT
tara:strand:+ start:3600 stop:4352 length:753 start_codon:yes stop_codon:yes gene_type:complete